MSSKKNAARILIIEDHPLLRQGIAAMINQQNDLVVCGEVSNSRETIAAVQKYDPAAILLDLSLDGSSGIEVLKDVKAQFPNVKVLILSMHDEKIYAPRALRAGAMGYVMKQEPPEAVLAAVRRVLTGQIALSSTMSARFLNSFRGREDVGTSPVELLSDRELEIFSLLGHGLSNGEIANRLNLSVKTVRCHRAHIKEKMQMRNGLDLMHQAIRWVSTEARGMEQN